MKNTQKAAKSLQKTTVNLLNLVMGAAKADKIEAADKIRIKVSASAAIDQIKQLLQSINIEMEGKNDQI